MILQTRILTECERKQAAYEAERKDYRAGLNINDYRKTKEKENV